MPTSVNPATGQILATYPELSASELEDRIERASTAFARHARSAFADRENRMLRAADILERVWGAPVTFDRNIGLMYEDGRGVDKDPVTACAWLAMAAERKYPSFIATSSTV